MRADLAAWVEGTRQRRQERSVPSPFATGLVSPDAVDAKGAWKASASALVNVVAGRSTRVHFAPGPSFARLEEGVVSLDANAVEDAAGDADGAERLLGLAAHEGAHVWLSEPLAGHGRRPRQLPLWVQNVLEDERIERAVAERLPVLSGPLQVARRDLLHVDPTASGVLEAFFALVRAPERLSAAQWDRHREFLGSAMEILTPFPADAGAVTRAAHRVVGLLPHELRRARVFPEIDLVLREGDLLRREGVRGGAERHEVPRPHPGGRGVRAVGGWRDAAGKCQAWPPVIWTDVPPNPAGYELLRRGAARDAATLAGRLRALLPSRPNRVHRHGRVDRRRLHAWRTDERLFRSAGGAREGLEIAIVVDLSGSMAGPSSLTARRMCVALSEAAATLPSVQLHAYGHTADRRGGPSTEILRLANGARGPVHAFGNLEAGGNNRDAHAYEVIGRDLAARGRGANGLRIALLVGDGRPAATGFSGSAAVEATRRAIDELNRRWGPSVLVGTRWSPVLERMHPGPHRPGTKPVDGLVTALEHCLRLARLRR